jgi:mRNA interferase HicA
LQNRYLCIDLRFFEIMKYSELKRILRKNGCSFDHSGGNHEIWYSPMTGKKFPVGRHDSQEVAPSTFAQIKRQAGI